MPIIESHTHYGRPVKLEGFNIIPISKSHQVRLGVFSTRLRWERPVGVLVHNETGEEQLLPIEDVTRKAQIAMILMAAAGWLFTRRRIRR
jgi:hypothetical protein